MINATQGWAGYVAEMLGKEEVVNYDRWRWPVCLTWLLL